MLKRFYPHEYVESAYKVNYKYLLSRNIKNLIFDIDNTLSPPHVMDAPEESMVLLKELGEMGFNICLLSNNSAVRVNHFNKLLNLNNIPRANKPLLYGLNKAMSILKSNKNNTAIIGDQVFTDIWCGNRKGIYTILVKPIVPKDEITVFIKRGLEKLIIDLYLKNKTKNNNTKNNNTR